MSSLAASFPLPGIEVKRIERGLFMWRRLAHLFGFRKKDEALEKRFNQIKSRYLEAGGDVTVAPADPLGQMRITGSFDKRTVIGAQTATKEKITAELLKSCARAVDKESDQ
jgi:hypothetical protein